MWGWDRATFVSSVDTAKFHMQGFQLYFSRIASSGSTGDCSAALRDRDHWINTPGFGGVPAEWNDLYAQYRQAIHQAVAVTQPLADLCAAGGGALPEGADRAIMDTIDITQNALNTVLVQAQAMP
jgi:hypothetical protein